MEEIWKDIPNYEDYYKVNNKGDVKSVKTSTLRKAQLGANGYFKIVLYKNGIAENKSIHQLVAEAFLNHKPCGFKIVVNHINMNKHDNRVENLELVTNRENVSGTHSGKYSKYVGVTYHKIHKKWMASIRINGVKKYLGYFTEELEASKAYQNKLKEVNEAQQ